LRFIPQPGDHETRGSTATRASLKFNALMRVVLFGIIKTLWLLLPLIVWGFYGFVFFGDAMLNSIS